MVSEDSTSRVMVLPVTEKQLACDATLMSVKRGKHTGLDEDLHDGSRCVVVVCVVCVVDG